VIIQTSLKRFDKNKDKVPEPNVFLGEEREGGVDDVVVVDDGDVVFVVVVVVVVVVLEEVAVFCSDEFSGLSHFFLCCSFPNPSS
jgi:hypothetical protein